MRGKVNIGLLTAAAFFAVFGKASVAEADYCDDPGQGLRACDQPRSGCEASRDPFGLNPFEVGADYTSYVEGILYLENLDADYDPDNVLLLADMPWSYEIVEQAGGNTTQKKYFPVAKITVDVEDGPYEERPDMVFVCDMHAREWTTSEACMALIDELVQNSADPDIADLLSAVEVWVVPYANPGGRYFEEYDHSIGKPITDYGEPWNKQISWRKNRYWTEDCETTYQNNPHTGDCNAAAGEYDGANVARNFSDGWQQASSDTVFDRAKMFPNYVDQQATPDHIQEPPEIHDCGGFNNQCPADHPNCVAWNQILVAGLQQFAFLWSGRRQRHRPYGLPEGSEPHDAQHICSHRVRCKLPGRRVQSRDRRFSAPLCGFRSREVALLRPQPVCGMRQGFRLFLFAGQGLLQRRPLVQLPCGRLLLSRT
jgi:hypothetical protein